MFLVLFIVIFAYFIYINFVKPSLYWQSKGVFHVKLWNRFLKVFLGRKSFAEHVRNGYDQFPERRYFGSYQFLNPALFVRDLELIRKITVKDFDYFPDHMGFSNEKSDPISGLNLFSLKGNKWRDMRSTLSPAFTSSKMRAMFTLMSEAANNFTNYFLEKYDTTTELEMKDVYSKYTTDVIASCAFGISCDSLRQENNEFFKMGKFITSPRAFSIIRGLLNVLFPKVFEIFKIPLFPTSVTDFFQRIVKDTISYREREGIIRPDIIHLLMEARKGKLKFEMKDSETAGFAAVEEYVTEESDNKKIVLTDEVITAQALIFFFAGFDTSSTLMSFLTYELALNPNIQKKLQAEIDEALKVSEGKIIYDEILKMRYLDQVISEVLRKYPPGYILSRVCSKNYMIPAKYPNEHDLLLEKGSIITIPVYGIHMDPEYFPNPDQFEPERFSDENKIKIIPGTFMPFGSGPRNCIGSRFALLESKALIVSFFSKFDVIPTQKTAVPLRLSKTLNLGVRDGFWLGLRKRPVTA